MLLLLRKNILCVLFFAVILSLNAFLLWPWYDNGFKASYPWLFLFLSLSWALIVQRAVNAQNVFFVAEYILFYVFWLVEEATFGVFTGYAPEHQKVWPNILSVLSITIFFMSSEILCSGISSHRLRRIICICFSGIKLIAVLIPILVIIYWHSTGAKLSIDGFIAIFQNHFQDIASYVSSFIPPIYIIGFFMLCPILVYLFVIGKPNGCLQNHRKPFCLLMLFFMIASIATYRSQKDGLMLYRVICGGIKYFQDINTMGRADKRNLVAEKGKNGLYIVVIGESQTRDHMGAYGYSRDTTPWLSSMQNDKRLVLFTNCYSCHTHTVPVILKCLTEDSQYAPKQIKDASSIIEILNASGYTTTWISNQNKYGVYDNPITMIAESAQQAYWANTSNFLKSDVDSVLLDPLQNILNNATDREVIFVHLMGCHGDYKDRYTQDFNVFDSSYDNSMLYNDFLVSSIFKMAYDTGKLTAFVYFPDHGEAVDKNLGHDSSKFDYQMTHIPLYAWFSEEYIKADTKNFNQLKERQNAYFTNDMMYDTLIGIVGVKTSAYKSNQDLSSPDYSFTKNDITTLNGKYKIADEPYR